MAMFSPIVLYEPMPHMFAMLLWRKPFAAMFWLHDEA